MSINTILKESWGMLWQYRALWLFGAVLVLVLLVLRLTQPGAGRVFSIAALVIGFASTAGTALMTATPFSVSPIVNKTSIVLYFLGVVVLQTLIFAREWSLKSVPKYLPILSLAMVVLYLVFLTLMILYEQGVVSRTAPVIWEWQAISMSVVWLLTQSTRLGRIDLRNPMGAKAYE